MPDGKQNLGNGDFERAQRFRLRAEEVRSIAEDMKKEKTRETLEKVAREYDQMAQMLEGKAPHNAGGNGKSAID